MQNICVFPHPLRWVLAVEAVNAVPGLNSQDSATCSIKSLLNGIVKYDVMTSHSSVIGVFYNHDKRVFVKKVKWGTKGCSMFVKAIKILRFTF